MSVSWTLIYNPSTDSLSKNFKTHLNYIKCMAKLSKGMTIDINISPKTSLDLSPILKFKALSRITKASIEGEKTACDREKAYAQVASPWIPVKCYYRLYYLESIFLYLLKNSRIGFGRGGHRGVRNGILDSLKNGEISLSGSDSSELSKVTNWKTANVFFTTSGANLSANYYNDDECNDSLRKKLADYIELDWKSNSSIINYRTKDARTKKTSELLPKEFILLDYFYWIRMKANYRDVDFLDFENNVNEADAYEYLTVYIKAVNEYASALKKAISFLETRRGM